MERVIFILPQIFLLVCTVLLWRKSIVKAGQLECDLNSSIAECKALEAALATSKGKERRLEFEMQKKGFPNLQYKNQLFDLEKELDKKERQILNLEELLSASESKIKSLQERYNDVAVKLRNIKDAAQQMEGANNQRINEKVVIGIEFFVAGVSHRNKDGLSRQNLVSKVKAGETLKIEKEINNTYDANALKVMGARWQIGYVPRVLAAEIAVENLTDIEAVVVSVGKSEKGLWGCKAKLRRVKKKISYGTASELEGDDPMWIAMEEERQSWQHN